MAIPRDNDLVTLGPFKRGANNLAREDAVPNTAFRKGVNIDVYPDGRTRRRKGLTPIDPTPTANFWGDGHNTLCTSADSMTLYRFLGPGQPLQTIYEGLRFEADIAYCSVNHLIYVSDGAIALRVDTADYSVRPWGVASPAGQPLLSAVAGGLAPGAYQVAVTNLTSDGEESGTGLAATITLAEQGGIRALLPAFPVPPYVTSHNVYRTEPGDSVFRLAGTYSAGALDIELQPQALGRELRTFGLEPMPPGSQAVLVGGFFVVVVGNSYVWSDPLNYGLTNYAKNFVSYAADIDLLAPTAQGAAADGMFVAAGESTYFASGNDIRTTVNQRAYGAGATRGSPVYINGDTFSVQGFPNQPLPVWLASNGQVCVGLPNGQVATPLSARYAVRTGDRVTLVERDLLGIDQLVINVRSPVAEAQSAASDVADSILVRNGVVIP